MFISHRKYKKLCKRVDDLEKKVKELKPTPKELCFRSTARDSVKPKFDILEREYKKQVKYIIENYFPKY